MYISCRSKPAHLLPRSSSCSSKYPPPCVHLVLPVAVVAPAALQPQTLETPRWTHRREHTWVPLPVHRLLFPGSTGLRCHWRCNPESSVGWKRNGKKERSATKTSRRRKAGFVRNTFLRFTINPTKLKQPHMFHMFTTLQKTHSIFRNCTVMTCKNRARICCNSGKRVLHCC